MNKIPELIDELRQGRMVILIDDEDRENEGDLICSADTITPEQVNFMAREARGLICLAMGGDRLQKLGIPLMVQDEVNHSPNRTAFTVSIEASHGVTTGISAADRAHTIRVACDPQSGPQDLIMPGHVFPIQAQAGGVLKRAGHTEASVDLSTLAGLKPAAVICEIMNEDGTMARVPDLRVFAEKHGLKMGTIEDLIEYRLSHDLFVEKGPRAPFSGSWGEGFEVKVFQNSLDGREHLAFLKGDLSGDEPVLVRVHSECILGDVFSCQKMPSGAYLQAALEAIDKAGRGVLVYLKNEGMQGRLSDRVRALQGRASEKPVESATVGDRRDYGVGAQILRCLGIHKIKLLTNTPVKRIGLRAFGLEIVDTQPLSPKGLSSSGVGHLEVLV